MFNSLLDLSKFDAGFSKKNNEFFQLSVLISRLTNTFLPIAEGKNITFKIDYTNMVVEGDILHLQQLLGNLISNAIYYTTQGTVTLKFSVINDQLHVSIRDTGHGIEASAMEKIFDEFYRSGQTRNMHDGLGLGLSIVKRLCVIIGAEISVQSEIGVGTNFNIQTSYQTVGMLASNFETFQDSALDNKNNISFERKVIAIFEDDPTIFKAYTKLLTEQDCNIISLSENFDEMSKQLVSVDCIDCILSDFRLEHTTGDQIIQFLRENFGMDIPAIIVTADTSPDHIQLFSNLNVVVLYKPVSYDEIVNQIKLLVQ
jgi:CheY-like chemotaxis protein/anti-sigma regulatory factor (Ser/Thr protein kinase)